MQFKKFLVSLCLLAGLFGMIHTLSAQNHQLRSPDQNIRVHFILDEGVPKYEVSYKGENFLKPSELGIKLKDRPSLVKSFEISGIEFVSIDKNWEPVYGTEKIIRNHYNEMTVQLVETDQPNRRMNLVFRAYDDGIAFRYIIPGQQNLDSLSVMDELTTFQFASDYISYGMDRIDFRDNYEQYYKKRPLSEITEDHLVSMPFLVQLHNGWTMVTEAALTNYAGMSLSGSSSKSGKLVSRLSPLPENNEEVKASIQIPFKSPWRTIMLADRAGDLITSNLVLNLNEPSKLSDTSFIQPGQMLFPWWNGRIAGNLERSGEPSTEVMKYYIDFAAEFDIPHLMVDAGWYSLESEAWEAPEEQNLLTMEETRKEYYDIREIIDYGNKKGVKVHVWVHLLSLKGQVEKVLSAYADWGVAGIKVDSFGGDDQQHIADFQEVVTVAAKHNLMVNFHGAYKPTGWSRTYPNLITREAVMANEHTIWKDNRMPHAAHNVTIPFTRMPVGPMDYTPGAFDLDGTEENPKYVKTTRAQQIAMFIVYYSPLQMIVDYPEVYRDNPEPFKFMTDIPVSWDETRFIAGAPGEYIVLARRSGNRWYIGAMTNDEPRELKIPVDFLDDGQNYDAQILADGEDAALNPVNVKINHLELDSSTVLKLKLQKSGGGAVILTPAD